jgi:aspartate aminotransferase
VSVFLQEAAQATLEQQEQVLPEMLEVLALNRQIMRQGLDAISGGKYYIPDGAYYFFPDFSYYLNSRTPSGDTLTTSTDLCRYLREDYQLELAPGDQFGATGHARMSFAIETPKLQEAMQRLKQALEFVDC